MKTCAESKNRPPFDWNAELQKKIDGRIKEPDEELLLLANGWPTCAVGRQCEAIPRSAIGMPIDMKLRQLGYDFAHDLSRADWHAAQATLAKIEARSTEILATL